MPIKFLNNVAVDSSVLYVDTINDRVGIGTANPAHALDVSGTIATDSSFLAVATQPSISFIDTIGGGEIFTSNGAMYFKTGSGTPTTKIAILSGGDVGIGTTTPTNLLHIRGGLPAIKLETTGGTFPTYGRIDAASGGFLAWANIDFGSGIVGSRWQYTGPPLSGRGDTYINLHDTNGIDIIVNDSQVVKIEDGGDFGINTTIPSQKLHVVGNARVTGAYYDSTNSPGTSGQILSSTATGTDWIDGTAIPGVPDGSGTANYTARWIDTDTLGTGVLYDNGTNVGIGTTSPGSKLEVAGDASSALLTLKSLNGGSNDSFMRFYDESNGPSYSVGLDSSDQKFKIAYDTDGDSLTTGTKLVMDTSGKVGIGTTFPSAKLDVAGDTTNTLLTLKSLNGGANDAAMRFYDESNGPAYVMGLDSSDEKFKIAFDYDNNSVSSGTKLTINTSGNVGIGTISPSQKLEVAGNIKMTETAAATDTDKFVVLDSGVLKYRTGTQVRSDIGAGNISASGFTMNDAAQIKTYQSINSGSSQSAATLITENDISFGGCINWWSEVQNGSFGTFNHAVFYHGTTFAGAIRRSGNTTVSYITSSDYRLKENVIEITDGIERVKQLKPSKFNFIGEDRIVDGFLAHEVQDVVPESISGEKDEEDDDGNPIYQGIDQSKMVPLLTAALQEAIAKIESLEARIQTLENK